MTAALSFKTDVLVPRLLPRNTLLPRLLPRELVAGGRSLQCSAFQGWSPGTRIVGLIFDRVTYKSTACEVELVTSMSVLRFAGETQGRVLMLPAPRIQIGCAPVPDHFLRE